MVVRQERTGWRDQALSLRHRDWGLNCPAVDIDFLMLEYDHGLPVALVEYKHEDFDIGAMSDATWNAFRVLCENSKIPLYRVVYAKDLSWYEVEPMNDIAAAITAEIITLSEHDYVALLYRIRNRKMTGQLSREIHDRDQLRNQSGR